MEVCGHEVLGEGMEMGWVGMDGRRRYLMLDACICYDILSDLRLYDSGGKDFVHWIGLLLSISSRNGVSFVYI